MNVRSLKTSRCWNNTLKGYNYFYYSMSSGSCPSPQNSLTKIQYVPLSSRIFCVLFLHLSRFGDHKPPLLWCRNVPVFCRADFCLIWRRWDQRWLRFPRLSWHAAQRNFANSPLPANKAGLLNKHPANKTHLKLGCLFHEWKFTMKINIFRDKKVHLKRVLLVQNFCTDSCWYFVWIAVALVGLSSNICLQYCKASLLFIHFLICRWRRHGQV